MEYGIVVAYTILTEKKTYLKFRIAWKKQGIGVPYI